MKVYFRKVIRIAIFALCFVLMANSWSWAQAANASLHGTVTDPSGAAITKADVQITAPDGRVLHTTTNQTGAYDVKGRAAGRYGLKVTAKGFAVYEVDGVDVELGQSQKMDVALSIEVQKEQVNVSENPIGLDTSAESNVSQMVLTGKDLDALSDDPDELATDLQALAGPSAGPNGGQIYIDGFTGGQLPPKSSIREIRINQNPFSAQYDRMGFGRIEILTKPGTDTPHGQFSYNDNHSLFDARNPFGARDAFGNVVEPDFSSEIVSGNMGGPLTKKASYFVSAERRDIHDAAIINTNAFTDAGIVPQGVLIPRVRTNISTRLDYQLFPSNTLMVRYQFTKNNEQNDGIGQLSLPSLAYNQNGTEHEIQISDTQILSPRAVNETRFEWEHGNTSQNSLTLTPTISVLGTFTKGGNSLGVSNAISDHFELQNYTSLNLGRHFIRFGGRLRTTAITNTSTQGFNGTFTFAATIDPVTKQQLADALQNFRAGQPSQFSVTVGNPVIEDAFVDAGFYAEDDFKFRPNMTLSYGLRFETQNGIQDHGDFAPRVGFAWGLGGKKNAAPKTVIRTGFGIFYDRFAQGLIMNTERLNGSNQQQFTISVDPKTGANQAALQAMYAAYPVLPPLSSLTAVGTTRYTIAPDLRAPYTMQAAASVERQLTKTSTLTVTYLHSQGLHQLFSVNTNALLNPTPVFEYISEGIYRQNQLITSFNMRVGPRLTLSSYYSLSYANSDTAGAGSLPSNPGAGITADYGRAAFDVRNRAFFIGTISLPHGFRVSPFLVANSGAPFNITTGNDLNGDSIFNDRPAFATSTTAAADLHVTPWGNFDSAPAPGD